MSFRRFIVDDAFASKLSSDVNNPEDNGNLLRMKIIKDFLSNESSNPVRFLNDDDDDKVDPSESIYKMRSIFDEVCILGDAMISSCCQNQLWHHNNNVKRIVKLFLTSSRSASSGSTLSYMLWRERNSMLSSLTASGLKPCGCMPSDAPEISSLRFVRLSLG